MKTKLIPSIIFLAVIAFSCQKENETQDTTQSFEKTIEHKWFLVNIVVYSNPELTGPSFFGYAGNGAEYYDFRADGKVYAFANGSFDTAVYKILSDSTLLMNEITNGVPATKTDSAKIRKLTADSLIFVARNPVNDYGKFTFRK